MKVELESIQVQISTLRREKVDKYITCGKEKDQMEENVINLHKETMTSLKETLNNIEKGK